MKKHHYDCDITFADIVLFVKYIETKNYDKIIKLLLEHKLDIDTIYYIATVERNFKISNLRFEEVKKEVLDIPKEEIATRLDEIFERVKIAKIQKDHIKKELLK